MAEPTTPSTQNDKLIYLMDQLQRRIAIISSSATYYRNRYYLSTMSTVFLSAVITMIAGWKPTFTIEGVNGIDVILVLGAASTVLSTWGAFYSPKESWINYVATLTRLRQLETRISFLVRTPDPIGDNSTHIVKLFDQYQTILDDHNRAWRAMRSASTSPSLRTDTNKLGGT